MFIDKKRGDERYEEIAEFRMRRAPNTRRSREVVEWR
jgi:hypothetical protein